MEHMEISTYTVRFVTQISWSLLCWNYLRLNKINIRLNKYTTLYAIFWFTVIQTSLKQQSSLKYTNLNQVFTIVTVQKKIMNYNNND